MEVDCGLATCPVLGGFYSYDPNLAGNAVLLVAFALLVPGVVYLGIRSRTLWLTLFLLLGLGFEILAFAGRLLIVRNNRHPGYFLLSLLGSVLGPSMLAASTLIVLPHVLRIYGEGLSPCRPVVAELVCYTLIAAATGVQLVGVVYAAYAFNGVPRTKGTSVVIGGLGVQTAALLGSAALYFSFVLGLSSGRSPPDDKHSTVYESRQFTRFLRGLELSTILLVACSIYRIVEMAGSLEGSLFQSEAAFMVMNGAMPFVSGLMLTIFHPGAAFGPAWDETSRRQGVQNDLALGNVEHRESYTPHHAYDPNIGRQRSTQSQMLRRSTSPGLPANPRPGNKPPSPNMPVPRSAVPRTAVPRVGLAPRRLSARSDRRVNVQQGMVDTDALW